MSGYLAAMAALHRRHDGPVPPGELAALATLSGPSPEDLVRSWRAAAAACSRELRRRATVALARRRALVAGGGEHAWRAARGHARATLGEWLSLRRRIRRAGT